MNMVIAVSAENEMGDGGSTSIIGSFLKPFAYLRDACQWATDYFRIFNVEEHQQRSHQEAARYAEEAWKETEMRRIEHEHELQLAWITMQADAGEPEYRCETCRAIFLTKNDLDGHSEIHAAKQRFRCLSPICGALFGTSDSLASHMEVMHGGMKKMLECPYVGCIARFSDSPQLVHHLEKHAASIHRSSGTGNC